MDQNNLAGLKLAPLQASDLAFLWRLHSDPKNFELDVVPPLDAVDQMQSILAQWLAQAKNSGFGYYVINLLGEGTPPARHPIGIAGFDLMELNGRQVANAYVRLISEATGQSIASAALAAAFTELSAKTCVPEAVFITATQNLPAQRVAEKLGFTKTTEIDSMESSDHVIYRRLIHTPCGRYAPSPSGDLHLGNLRTAILAWVLARQSGRNFLLRVEDIDLERSKAANIERQLADLAQLGIDFDETKIPNPKYRSELLAGHLVQSKRSFVYEAVIDALKAADMVYECYCSRKEIQAAPSAPHAPAGAYPGTCRNLSEAERRLGRSKVAGLNKAPALRLRANLNNFTVTDEICGEISSEVDDFVLRRGDGMWAYNLAVVVDDLCSGVDQIVRADDLISSSPRQSYLRQLVALVLPDLVHPALIDSQGALKPIEYIHVPLALNAQGQRLAKRDAAVTLRERLALGQSVQEVIALIAASLNLRSSSVEEILQQFEIDRLPLEPWVLE